MDGTLRHELFQSFKIDELFFISLHDKLLHLFFFALILSKTAGFCNRPAVTTKIHLPMSKSGTKCRFLERNA